MKALVFLLAGGAALAASAALGAQARDWTQTIVATPEGGFRMGNPQAPVKLIEYGSLACPTCGRFHAEGKAPLMEKVKSGKVSFEFRNYVLNLPDMAASVLSRCAGAQGFFRLHDAYYGQQAQWLDKARALPEARLQQIQAAGGPEKQAAGLASALGLDAIATKAGLPAARAKQCLADPEGVERLLAMRQAAWATYRVSHTPTFVVNGQVVEAHSWAELAPLLNGAGG